MGDKRTDSGQFYPGGRVIARPGTAPQQVVVQWSDVQNKPQVAPLSERYRDSDMKNKINEIASKFATAIAVALIGWTALAGLVVQKAQKDQIWNDEEIVTNAYLTGENASGAARILPKYLWLYEANDSYPDEAAEYYRLRGTGEVGGCSAVRDGGFLYRNFDFPFDDRAEFVVRMSAGAGRFASVGVAQVGTNLTEEIVTSGRPEFSHRYKWLPGATVDGINENGVVAEINVVDLDPLGWRKTGNLHPLAAVRWVLDHATNAQHAAKYLEANVRLPEGWTQNFHYMIADSSETWVVENGFAHNVTNDPYRKVLTNFQLLTTELKGEGYERWIELNYGANITNVWYTNAYRRETNPPWVSDLADVLAYTNDIFNAWATHPKEYFRGKTNGGEPWWQTVHTSVYDITNRVLRVAVQETDDWYVFSLAKKFVETDPTVPAWAKQPMPPESMPSTGVVWNATRGRLVTKSGAKTIAAEDVGALPAVVNEHGLHYVPTMVAMTNSAAVFGSFYISDDVGYVNVAPKIRDNAAEIADLKVGKSDVGHTHDLGEIRNVPNFVKTIEVTLRGTPNAGNYVLTPGAGGYLTFPTINVDGKADAATTLAGYGITDALPIYQPSAASVITVTNTTPLLNPEVRISRKNANGTVENFRLVQVNGNSIINHSSGGGDYDIVLPKASGTVALAKAASLNAMLEDADTNQTARATTGANVMSLIDQPVSQKINASVSANLNTYVDGETGVEYVGKFYEGSLYYVPTGNVYPPNN